MLSQRLGILETLNGVYMKIEQASTDVEIMKAYESSTKTLQSVLAAPSLQTERVSQTVEELSEQLLEQQAVDGMINEAHGQMDEMDEQDIAAELAGLLDSASQPPPEPLPLPSTSASSIDDLQAQLARLNVPELDPQPLLSDKDQPLKNQPLPS